MATEYIVLCGQIVGPPFECLYGFDGERFFTRKEAIAHGFTLDRSDDFNIGVLKDGSLVSVDWMDKPKDTDPQLMLTIERQLCL